MNHPHYDTERRKRHLDKIPDTIGSYKLMPFHNDIWIQYALNVKSRHLRDMQLEILTHIEFDLFISEDQYRTAADMLIKCIKKPPHEDVVKSILMNCALS